jgi:hypothetical protein
MSDWEWLARQADKSAGSGGGVRELPKVSKAFKKLLDSRSFFDIVHVENKMHHAANGINN